MRFVRSAALALSALVMAAVIAFAQDAKPEARPVPTGNVLLAAVPARADLVVHTSDLRGLLDSAEKAGLGPATAWKDAFHDQVRAWLSPDRDEDALRAGADQLLGAADGEALAYSQEISVGGTPRRAVVLGLRTSRTREELNRALDAVIAGALRDRYPGELTDELLMDRPVRSLAGIHDRLYFLTEDGLLLVADDALALGLFLRGLERAAASGNVGAAGEPVRLEVRYGPPDTRWTGWRFGPGETVSWPAGADGGLSSARPVYTEDDAAGAPAVGVALDTLRDVPLLPAPLAASLAARTDAYGALGTGGLMATLRADGALAVSRGGLAPDLTSADVATRLGTTAVVVDGAYAAPWAAGSTALAGDAVPGCASRLGWLRALANGGLASPLAGIAPERFAGPWAAALAAAGKDRAPHALVPWRAGDREGEVLGPAWHGPATLLALRTLRHISRGIPPGATAPPRAPVERAPADGAPLPPPVKDREDR